MLIKLSRFFLLPMFFGMFISNSFSQTQSVAFSHIGKGVTTPFVTDYHTLGINVSNLGIGTGYDKKKFTMGSSEFGFGMYSDSLDAKKLRSLTKTIIGAVRNKSTAGVNFQQQAEAAAVYAQAGIAMYADYNWGGISFYTKKFGGIAFNVRESYSWYSKMNQQTTDIVFRGRISQFFDSVTVNINNVQTTVANNPNMAQDSLAAVVSGKISVPLNLSQLTNGTEIKMQWNRSYNFGYGRRLFGKDSVFEVFAGIGGRIISSMAMFDMESNGNGLTMYTSINPTFGINVGNISGSNILASAGGGLPPAVGNGYGIDFAGTVSFFGKLRLTAAVNNIGKVTYKRNVYKVSDTLFGEFTLAGLSTDNITKTMEQLLRQGGILNLVGQDKYELANAADIRFGAAFEPIKEIKLGLDIVAPFDRNNPGAIQNPIISFGAEIRPIPFIALNVGYFGGGLYKNNIPCGITFIGRNGSYEVGVASRDALSFFTQESNSVSFAMGFARFRF